MGATETARDALFGNPPQANMEPSREGVLAAFADLDRSVASLSSIALGVKSYATAAALPVSPVPALGTMARVYDDPTAANNVFWVYKSGGWQIDANLMTAITVQLSSTNSWTGVQSFTNDIFLDAARVGFDGGNIRFGQDAVRTAASGLNNIGIGGGVLAALTTGDRNVVTGFVAGQAITTGSDNILYGRAGYALTTGARNVFIGPDTAAAETTGTQNVAIGINAMRAARNCVDVIAIGEEALAVRINGAADIAIGKGAGQKITTGVGNVSIGHNANAQCTTGGYNLAVGYEALVANVTGAENTAIGLYALDNNKASRNCGFGYGTGYRQTNGTDNLFVGYNAGRGEDASPGVARYWDGNRNTIMGVQALSFGVLTGADDNTAVGYRAGYLVTTGTQNLLLGGLAGDNITTGSGNIVLGYNQDADSPTGSNQINIGGRYFHDRIRLLERSSDPAKPAEGNSVIWMSDGTGLGDDGDIMSATTVGGVTRVVTLHDYSAGAVW